MSKPAFTPGPWLVPHFTDDRHPCDCKVVLSGSHLGGICEVFIGNGLPISSGGNDRPPLDQARANAHLIAAAPDMYEALLKARIAVLTWSPSPDEPLADIDAAIAKAEGRAA